MKWVMWQVIAGSVHETGGLVVYFGSVGGQKKGGGKLTWGPTEAKPAVLGCQHMMRG